MIKSLSLVSRLVVAGVVSVPLIVASTAFAAGLPPTVSGSDAARTTISAFTDAPSPYLVEVRDRYYGGGHNYRPYRRYGGQYRRPYANNYGTDHHGRGCHEVSKTDYWHGRLASVHGTQCYDHHGNPYIVRGSRYVDHYY